MNQGKQPIEQGRDRSWPRALLRASLIPVVALAVVLSVPQRERVVPGDERAVQVLRAETWLIWSILMLLALMGALTLAWVLALRRRALHPDPALALMDEVYLSQQTGKSSVREENPKARSEEGGGHPADSAGPSSEESSWQRDGDWWKLADQPPGGVR